MICRLQGHLLDAPNPRQLRSIPDGALIFDTACGRILASGAVGELEHSPDWQTACDLTPATAYPPLILPGFVDAHAHLPQYPAVARHPESLLPWLEKHIFPLEKHFRGPHTRALTEHFFDDLACHGITCASLFGALWPESTDEAFAIAEQRGMRLSLGKVMMDVSSYGEPNPAAALEKSLRESAELIEQWHGKAHGLLRYAVSPRFAVTSSAELLKEAATLADRHGCLIQTHLAENRAELATVRQRFPEAKDYTDVYDRAHLLGPRTVLGHAIHLSQREIDTIADRGSHVAHCPTSNLFLRSGLMPLNRLLDAGIAVGLGSDVAGGPELNPWQIMRSAIETQTARHFQSDAVPLLSPAAALHLATVGGATVLGLNKVIGTLDAGMDADLIVVDHASCLPPGTSPGAIPSDYRNDPDTLASLLIHRGHAHCITAAYVRGRLLAPFDSANGDSPRTHPASKC